MDNIFVLLLMMRCYTVGNYTNTYEVNVNENLSL